MGSAAPDAPVAQRATEPPDRVRVTRDIGRESVPGIKSGPARIVVTASRPVLFGMRQAATETAHDVEVRLERPRIAALSTHHYINQGGAEVVVYRVTPDDVDLGRRGRRHRVRRLPRNGSHRGRREHRRPCRAGRLLRAALRPAARHADPLVRARRGRQLRARRVRPPHVPEAHAPEPHRPRRRVPRARGARHPRGHHRGQAHRHAARTVPGHQRRATPEEQRDHRVVRRQDLAPAPLSGRGLPSLHQHRGRVRLRRSAHLRLPGQGRRSTDAPRLRPGLLHRHADRRRRRVGRCCSRTSWGSTATA